MEKIWTTSSGDDIKIKDMTNSHLVNTIKMLNRTAEDGRNVVMSSGYFGDDNFTTGDTEWLQGKDYLDSIEEYPWLIEEAKKRNLLHLI